MRSSSAQQPLARARRSRRVPRVLGLALQRHAVALGQRLERLAEVEPLGLHHELEDVAARAAAEAVVELLDRVDPERRRALVVERAQPLQPRARRRACSSVRAPTISAKSTASRTRSRDSSRVARHQSARPCGTKRSVQARIAKRSVIPAR